MISNSLFLTIVQLINLIVPLLVYPYLYNVFGLDDMGEIIIRFMFVDTILLISMYGFDITAYRDISRVVSNKFQVSKIISKVLFSRLFIVMLVFLPSVCFISGDFSEVQVLAVYLFFGTLVNPWFFIAVNKAKIMCIITLIAKVFFLVFVFSFLSKGSDIVLYLYALTFEKCIIAIAFLFLFRHLGYKITFVHFREVCLILKKDFTFFLSRVMVTIYIRSNTLVLGFMGINYGTAVFDFSNKILSAMKIPPNAITQVFYARMTKDFDAVLAKKIAFFILFLSIVGLMLVLSCLDFIVNFLTNAELLPYSKAIALILLAYPVSTLSSFLGTCVLNANDLNFQFKISVFAPTVIFFFSLLMFYIFDLISLTNISLLFLVIECLILLMRIIFSVRFFCDKKSNC